MFKGWKQSSKGVSENAMVEQARLTAEELGLELPAIAEMDEKRASVEIPPGLEFVWETFIDLCNSRQNGFAANPIMWSEIQAWTRLHRVRLDPFELAAIKMLDLKWLKIVGAPDANPS